MLSYFFDETFAPVYEYRFNGEVVKAALSSFAAKYSKEDDNSVWFDKVKQVATELGFATDMKAYKQNPEAFPGSVADIAEILRIATTGLSNTPDLWTIMQILGEERALARLNKAIAAF